MDKMEAAALTPRSRLLYEMEQGLFAACDRLPPENELCLLLGVSRTQLRDSLSQLDREGFISRCHGVGTLINRHVLRLQTRMDIEVEFMDMIKSAGFTPQARFLGAAVQQAGDLVAERLQLDPQAWCLYISKLVLADQRPAIYCQDVIACQNIRDRSYREEVFERPVFDFLRQYCGLIAMMDVTQLSAVSADAQLAAWLQVPQGAPLLYMDEVDYDRDGRPILYARQYYADGIIKHSLVRKKF